ncbi:hypothetical protein, partial [Romboutsia sp.]|uniref:hypothetical protein n=1 Tax=Romboutsia sp. TaxID=1965302 RepID=UPI002D09F291
KYIENLLRSYKKNKARLRILELGHVSDIDNVLGGIDYSKDKIQTSNLSSLDNIIEAREREQEQLKIDIGVTDALLDSLSEKDRFLTWQYYIEKRTQVQIAHDMNYYDVATVWRNRDRIIKDMIELV